MPPHPAYMYPDGSAAKARAFLDALPVPGQLRLGDVRKAVTRIIELSRLPEPPMRLFLGQDALATAQLQLKFVADDLKAYESWSEDLLEEEV